MNSLKTLLGATLLAALAYGVYVGITRKPSDGEGFAIVKGPQVDLGRPDSAPNRTGEGAADDATEAPPFAVAVEKDAPIPFAESARTAWEQETSESETPTPPSDDPPLPAAADVTAEQSEPATPTSELASYEAATPGDDTTSAAPPPATGYFQTKLAEIERQLELGQLADAHLALSKFYGDPGLNPEEHQRVVDLLSQLAGTVVYSREHLLAPPHAVVAGETLEQIAANCNVPWQLLAKINGLPGPGPLQPGQQLKVVNGPFHAYVDLEDRQLVLFLDGKYYAGRFPVAFGKEVEPQPGPYAVKNKLEAPTYFGSDQTSFGPGDPQNPLGTRKIELDRQLSIHGTNDPASLDREDPRGCIRLSPRDAEDVYDILTVGSEVVIQR